MSEVIAPPRPQLITPALRQSLVITGLGLLVLAALFNQEITAATRVWLESTAYNHCFLIIPLAAYLIWDRRAVLVGAIPSPWAVPALLALPVGLVWLLADRIGVMEGRQLMAMTLVQILFVAMLGWRLYRALMGPLLYLYFLVPFGAFITPALQDFTTAFAMHGLDILGIPNFTDGYTIDIPEGSFYVAEACAGLRFLIAAVAFGTLYALLMYRSALRRSVFILVSIIVPIVANGFRALGIVLLGRMLGSAQAAATDHILYGWMFFSIVILLLVFFGLPFREDDAPAARFVPPPSETAPNRSRLRALASVLVFGAIGPLAGLGLDRAAAASVPDAPHLPIGACTRTAPDVALPSPATGRIVQQHLDCGRGTVAVITEIFSPRVDPGAILAEERRITGLGRGDVIASATLPASGVVFRLQQTEDPKHTAASAMWVGGHPTTGGRDMRLRQGWASIAGSRIAPLVIAVMPEPDPSGEANGYRLARTSIEEWLHRQPDLAGTVTQLTSSR